MQSFVLSIAVTMVAGSILSMALPKGNMKRVMSFVLNMFFIASLLSPFLLELPKIDLEDAVGEINSSEQQTKIEQQTVDLASATLKKSILKVLEENGYNVVDLNIEINLEGQNTQAEVILNEEDRKNESKIVELIKEQTAMTPKVEYLEQ